jgi:hypothetical protein
MVGQFGASPGVYDPVERHGTRVFNLPSSWSLERADNQQRVNHRDASNATEGVGEPADRARTVYNRGKFSPGRANTVGRRFSWLIPDKGTRHSRYSSS